MNVLDVTAKPARTAVSDNFEMVMVFGRADSRTAAAASNHANGFSIKSVSNAESAGLMSRGRMVITINEIPDMTVETTIANLDLELGPEPDRLDNTAAIIRGP